MIEEVGVSIQGHVKITSYSDDQGSDPVVHLDKRNAVHKENMSLAISRALAGMDSGHVYRMDFGSGGATVDETGSIQYSDPNVTGAADLNVPAYFEVVDPNRGAASANSTDSKHVNGTLVSDVEIRCVLEKGEPIGQAVFDSMSINPDSTFLFDEIALKSDDGLLLTHIVFNPIEKAANRVLEVVYTLRIRVL